jgi:hypothetical protein
MTALVTGWPRYSSAACLSFWRIIAEICGGAYSSLRILMRTSLPAAETVYGTIFISSLTSSYRRPMNRLMEKMVFSGLVTGLAFRHLTDQPLPRFGERHDRGRETAPLRVGDDDGLAALHHCHDGVGGAEVDADDFAHVVASFFRGALVAFAAGTFKVHDRQ